MINLAVTAVLALLLAGCSGLQTSFYTEGTDPLESISVPSNWALIANYPLFDQHRAPFVHQRVRLGSAEKCASDIADYADISRNADWISDSHCLEGMIKLHGNPSMRPLFKDVMLQLVDADSIRFSRADYVHYTYYDTVMVLALLYAVEKPRLGLSPDETARVEQWLLQRVNVPLGATNPARNPPCTAMQPRMYIDDCGSTRQRYTLMNLVVGLLAQDQPTFDRGIDSLRYLHRFIDENGVYKGMAVRGGLAAHYHVGMTDWFSHYAEVLATLGVDYFNYIAPSGASIADSMAFTFSITAENNTAPLMKYAKMNKGNKGCDASILKDGPGDYHFHAGKH